MTAAAKLTCALSGRCVCRRRRRPAFAPPAGAQRFTDIDAQPVMTALNAIDGVVNDAVEWAYELPGSLRAAQFSPTFGVFASGQWAHVSHDGFFGKSRVSFGALKFEPGIYSEHRLENGWILSPYARGEMQVRFGYRNTGSFEGTEFDFDESDVSLSLSAGLNLKTSPKSTMSAEIRGKTSPDSSTIAGKIGYKVAF
jgi:hypothetical protein